MAVQVKVHKLNQYWYMPQTSLLKDAVNQEGLVHVIRDTVVKKISATAYSDLEH